MKRLRDYDVQGSTWRCLLARALRSTVTVAMSAGITLSATTVDASATFKKYCFQCHGKAAAGGLNLEQLTVNLSAGQQFQKWRRSPRRAG